MSDFLELGARCRVFNGDEIFDDLTTYLEDRLKDYADFAVESANCAPADLQTFLTEAMKIYFCTPEAHCVHFFSLQAG